jgi:hypothetical protein
MIDLLPMWPEARRKGLRLLGDIESADQRLGGRARQAIGEGLARCSRPPVTLGPPSPGYERLVLRNARCGASLAALSRDGDKNRAPPRVAPDGGWSGEWRVIRD